ENRNKVSIASSNDLMTCTAPDGYLEIGPSSVCVRFYANPFFRRMRRRLREFPAARRATNNGWTAALDQSSSVTNAPAAESTTSPITARRRKRDLSSRQCESPPLGVLLCQLQLIFCPY